ncbi:MAG: hypothetical protein OXG33_13090 [Chloroflexi bacterium]|nr:hypothetical protein [Chloroflexota bacterium]
MTPRPPLVALRAVAKLLCLAASVLALVAVLAPSVGALDCEGTPLDGGCLFTITGGDTDDPDDGFAVTNADDVPMWDFVLARDLQAIGYPISQRWVDGPFTLQAFQKVILQWDATKARMNYYNTLDVLANRYPDVELPNVPPHQVLEADRGADFATITRNHLALLEPNAAIKARFLSEPDWLNLYGLPIRYEEREVNGNSQGLQMLRAQRTVFVIWNVPAPGTTVGRVNLQNVPDKVKKLSNVIIPDEAKAPVGGLAAAIAALDTTDAAPWPAGCVVLSDIVERHNGNGPKVGIYQRVFGDQAEGACQFDHRPRVSTAFAWAFSDASPSAAADAAEEPGGWPATCVELHDIVASHLGNDDAVGIYQRTVGDQAEAACRQDRADDVRAALGWAAPCAAPAGTFHDLAQAESALRMVVIRLPWLACHVYPWLADDVSADDFQSLQSLMNLAQINESFARELASYPWFTDGVDTYREAEWGALRDLTLIAEEHPELLTAIRELSWITDARPDPTSFALLSLTRLAASSVELAILAATSPWMTDGVTDIDADGLGALGDLAQQDLALTRRLLDYTLTPTVTDIDLLFLNAIEVMRRDYPQRYQLLARQPWFVDGLDATERAVIFGFKNLSDVGFEEFVQNPDPRYYRSLTATMPISGEITLWAFDSQPLLDGEVVLELAAEAARELERFMGIPFPMDSIIIRFIPDSGLFLFSGAFNGEYIKFSRKHVGIIEESDRDSVYHETAHFYFNEIGPYYAMGQPQPNWLDEGGANFMESFIHDRLGTRSLQERLAIIESPPRRCHEVGYTNIHKLSDPDLFAATIARIGRQSLCRYSLGEEFLINLLFTMGEPALAAALREVYLTAHFFRPMALPHAGAYPTDLQLFETFLKHTPPGREDAVLDVYRRLHGGPFIPPPN